MADVISIGQAKLYQVALSKIFGVTPVMDIQEKTVRVYYPPDKLGQVQKKYESMVNKKSTVQVDFLPVILPHVLKNSMLPLLGVFGTGLYFGSKK